MSWKGKWIWDDGEAGPRNYYVAARREFEVNEGEESGQWWLRITADTRYRVWLNGEWIGDGPARGFAWNWQYDRYDVSGIVRAGWNVIAVVAHHWGEGTMQYAASGRAGLLAQIERERDGEQEVVVWTDERWEVRRHEGYVRPMPRMSLQMGFVEAYDARRWEEMWLEAGGGRGFVAAREIGEVGIEPWTKLSERGTPHLTRTPMVAERVTRVRVVRPANLHLGYNLRPYLLRKSGGGYELPGFVACVIESPSEQEIRIWAQDYFDWQEQPYVNGVKAENGVAMRLAGGTNVLVLACAAGARIVFDRSYACRTEREVRVRGVFQEESPFTVFGPVEHWASEREKVCAVKSVQELERWREFARPIRAEDVYAHGTPWAETSVNEGVEEAARVERLEALMSDGGERCTIYPAARGDVEVTLDFGKVLVGWLMVEVEAEAGVMLDFNLYEAIEDGRIHYTQGNQNGMRYITRAGRQRYVSLMRRGGRYVQITLRGQRGPVWIHGVRMLFATHPMVRRGAFACSDALLTQIWEVGRHTLRCCSEDTYTDCPTYEQGFWVGDARNEALVDYASVGNVGIVRRGIELAAESLRRAALPECCIPQTDVSILPAWSLLWVQMVEEQWQYSGDRAWLAGVYPAVRKTLRACREEFTDERGLMSIAAWNMFDWAGMDSGHRCVSHNSMFLVEAYKRAVVLAREVGEQKDAAWYEAEREALIEAINRHLWNEERQGYVDAIHEDGKQSAVISQQNNALALLYDVAQGARRGAVWKIVSAPPDGVVRVGSPFALFYIMEALAKEGQYDEIVAAVRERWGEMIKKGATTFWEVFPGFEKEWWTRSHCHAWSAAPVYFLTRYQLGVWSEEAGYRKVRIAPVPCGLTWAEGRVPTPHGEIEVMWEQKEERFEMKVKLPAGVEGTVVLPVSARRYGQVRAEGCEVKRRRNRWEVKIGGERLLEIRAEEG